MTDTNKSLPFIVYGLRVKEGLRLLLAAALMLCGLTAQGQDYVFMYNGYFLGSNTTTPTTSFVPNASIYTQNGASFRNANGYYLRPRNGNGTLRFNTTQYNNWAISGQNLVSYSSYYLVLNNNTWALYNQTNNRAIAYEVTTEEGVKSLSDFAITSGPDIITTTGNYTYGHSNTFYSTYTRYTWTNNTYYSTNPANAASTLPPTGTEITTGYTWSLSTNATGYATVSSGTINVSAIPSTDIDITLTCSITSNGVTKSATKTITLYAPPVAPTITRDGNDVTLATSSTSASIYYTTDGSTPSSSSTAYSGPFSITGLTYPVTVKAIAVRGGSSSTIASATYVRPICASPVIRRTRTGFSISCPYPTENYAIHFTYGANPANPTSSSPTYTAPVEITLPVTVKAFVMADGHDNSDIVTANLIP